MEPIIDTTKLAFIIAHKYISGYPSYLKYYIDNINKFYINALIIVVDNNSTRLNEITEQFFNEKNIIFLTNNTDCKFEIGAYKVGINYLINNDLIENYDYYIFTQDTYVLKNKYDFNILKDNQVEAGAIIGWNNDLEKIDVCYPVLSSIGLLNRLNETNLCWCNSFVISKNKILGLYNLIYNITIVNRHQSEASERYLGRVLFELNNYKNFALDGDDNNYIIDGITHNCLSVNIFDNINKFFCKVCQQKNERTKILNC